MVGAVNGTLDTAVYPAVSGVPPKTMMPEVARGGSGRWQAAQPEKCALIVFVVGAVSYNEIRTAHEVAKECDVDVFIGSHEVTSPTAFLSKVAAL